MQQWLKTPFDEDLFDKLFPKSDKRSETFNQFVSDKIEKTEFESEKKAHINRYRSFLQKNQFYSNEFKLTDNGFEVIKNDEVNFDFYSISTKIGKRK